MTNQELLKQAKDQVAQQTTRPGELCTYLNWDQLVEIGPSWKVVEVLEKAANLAIQIGKQEWWDLAYKRQEEAIQSAREEAAPTLSKEDFFKLIGADWNHANANIIWDTLDQHGYKIKKLTAPGR